jgi:S1-C subfamily serine protease
MELRMHPERWFRDGAIQWSHQAGKAQVTLAGIEPGTDCGLQNGDQILSINGYPSTDKAALKRLEQELSKADQLVIRVQRADQVKALDYGIVERLPDP